MLPVDRRGAPPVANQRMGLSAAGIRRRRAAHPGSLSRISAEIALGVDKAMLRRNASNGDHARLLRLVEGVILFASARFCTGGGLLPALRGVSASTARKSRTAERFGNLQRVSGADSQIR